MSDLKYIPISCLDEALLQPLMEDEERMWRADLDWDYAPIRQVLVAFIKQKLLPGYAAIADSKALGYTYFLMNQSKGVIGALYAMNAAHSQEAVDELLSLSISCLKDTQNVKRVEAQIMPFHHLNIASAFTRNGFSHCRRYYLDLDLEQSQGKSGITLCVEDYPLGRNLSCPDR